MVSYEDAERFTYMSNGILTTEEFRKQNIGKFHIKKLIQNEIIERYERGVYLRFDIIEDEYYILQKKNPSIIFSFNTAMYFHDEAERTPMKTDITIYSGYNAKHLPKNINIHYVKKEKLQLGAMIIKTPFGFEVTTYDKERIFCDLVMNKENRLEKEYVNKYLRTVLLYKRVDSIKLMNYAKLMGCEKKVRDLIEVFM